ncbi:hypothetical protein Pint_29567 [Pistacia integerrima]|uniref:Uncharacterized protein n=1 Tax=Pistacia integerrima TaxID=434235 RepID=A0ACC0X2C0_9ROSI|nr:hypothetical protein Pint_29567 [Pistacia integerrima]
MVLQLQFSSTKIPGYVSILDDAFIYNDILRNLESILIQEAILSKYILFAESSSSNVCP